MRKAWWLGFAALLAVAASRAQVAPRAKLEGNGGRITIEGTSTLHAWRVEGGSVRGTLEISRSFFEDPTLESVPELAPGATPPEVRIAIPVASLKSESARMDRVMHAALRAAEHPEIRYVLRRAELAPGSDPTRGSFALEAEGDLTVAGTTREVAMRVKVERQPGRVDVWGEVPLKMSDFGIRPPTALMGSIRSGDAVTVAFRWEAVAADE